MTLGRIYIFDFTFSIFTSFKKEFFMKQQQRECAPSGEKKWFGKPGSARALKNFVGQRLGIEIPDVRVCGHHAAPMDYLWYAYSRDFPWMKKDPLPPLGDSPLAGGELARSIAVAGCNDGRGVVDSGRMPELPLNGDCIVWANRAGGKTQLAAVATLLEGLFKPGCQTRILSGSLAQSGRMYGYLRDFVHWRFPDHLDGKLLKESCRFVNGTAVEILSQSSRSVRGQHVHKLRCDEVELFDDDVLHAAKFITQSTGGKVAAMEMLSTLHRPYGLMQRLIDDAPAAGIPVFKWCMWEVIERCRDRSCSRCPLDDDCQGKARRARGYLKIDDVISQMRRSSRAGFESEMLCLRPNLENAVFEEFDVAEHVSPVGYNSALPLFRAMDFGFTNPFVCLWIQVDDDGVVRVIDEYVQKKMIIAEHAAVVMRKTPCDESGVVCTFCDPAGAQANGVSGTGEVKVLRDMGMRVQYQSSRIVAGIEKIRAAVRAGDGRSRLVIDPKCSKLIEAMQCYHYPDAGGELPEKDGVHDHPIDALRYFFVNYRRSKGASCMVF
jgi:hypothetical protein